MTSMATSYMHRDFTPTRQLYTLTSVFLYDIIIAEAADTNLLVASAIFIRRKVVAYERQNKASGCTSDCCR